MNEIYEFNNNDFEKEDKNRVSIMHIIFIDYV